MNTIVNIKRPFNIINGLGLALIAICFIFINFNSNPAETQLTYLPLLLPLFFLLPVKKEIYRDEIKFLILILCIFSSSILSYAVQGEIFTHDFRSHWIYLISIGIFVVLIQSKISKNYLFVILIMSSFLVAYNVFLEYFGNGVRGSTTHGKPIFFGNIALTTGLVSLILSLSKDNHWLVKILLLLSAIFGVAGSIWSQTRGGWVFLILFMVIFAYNYILNSRNKKRSLLYGVCSFIILCIIALPFKGAIESRVSSGYTNIESYFSVGNAGTSVGLRFEFWRVATEQFVDNPLIGSARSGFLAKKNQMIAKGEVIPAAKSFEHAHSDFFWTIGTKGLLGLLSLYGLYMFLFRFYYINSGRKEVRMYALSGLTVVTSYLVYGLSESFFSMKLGIGYFIIINAILMRLICTHPQHRQKPLVLLQGNH
jgi:O-antigen ligase